MKLNGTNNIITDKDIVMTEHYNQSLYEILKNHTSEINSLKSNVKWIYKYGGVGSGGSGGGAPSKAFSIYATLDNSYLIDNGNTIVLEKGESSYKLHVKINNPNGANFHVLYSYTMNNSKGESIELTRTEILSIENNYELNTTIKLNNNDNITIVASDGNTTKLVQAFYITSAYKFTAYLCDDDDNELSNDIFLNLAKQKGFNVKLNYLISIDAEVKYTYQFDENEKDPELLILDMLGIITKKVDESFLIAENSGLHSVLFTITLNIVGLDPIILEKRIAFNLIPENLYILCTPEYGTIYNKKDINNPFLFNSGTLILSACVYHGLNKLRDYTIEYETFYTDELGVEHANNDLLKMSVIERRFKDFRILLTHKGCNRILLKTSYGDERATYNYYLYVNDTLEDIDWYSKNKVGVFNYFRQSSKTKAFINAPYNLNCLITSKNTNPIKINNLELINVSGSDHFDTNIAISLQYNKNNGDNNTILIGYEENKEQLRINKNGLVIYGNSQEYVFPASEGYNILNTKKSHLLNICSHYVKTVSNIDYYEILIYIDGVLESALGSLIERPLLLNDIELSNINAIYNLVEVSYFKSTNENIDLDMYGYYLKYKNTLLEQLILTDLELMKHYKSFETLWNGDVMTTQSDIESVARLLKLPCLMLSVSDNTDETMTYLRSSQPNPATYLNVGVSWSSGESALNKILLPNKNLQFTAKVLGTSTKGFKSKNLNLTLENSDQSDKADVYLYSPNFKTNDPNTFLPEKTFTLKADVVDSSHSNNTSIGKFVNTVCEKFKTNVDVSNKYSKFVKNCLLGFPVLLFININKTDPGKNNEYYYFGVYNFNLGRDSYFNLGYCDFNALLKTDPEGAPLLKDAAESSFTFYSVTNSEYDVDPKLIVGEILENDAYFDFSLWDTTILFLQPNYNDDGYMIGDIVSGDEATYKDNIINMVERVAKAGGFIFEKLHKNFGPYFDKYNAVDSKGNPINLVPDYHTQYYREFENNDWQHKILRTIENSSLTDLTNAIIPNEELGTLNFIDYTSLSEYYTICMAFGLVDSVLKNLNIKTWNQKTFYTAFYDMDTCLGINNEGDPTTYFAFSDYWDLLISISGKYATPKNIRVYRDFYPPSRVDDGTLMVDSGFDVPSSYLFAIAKYAKLFLGDAPEVSKYPLELWALWRKLPSGDGAKFEGCLRSADYFIDNFFNKNLKDVPEFLISMNYRTKYFILNNNTMFDSVNFKMFHGTRIAYVKEWLEGRLHLLDAYFNLQHCNNLILEYNKETKLWIDVFYEGSPLLEPTTTKQIAELALNKDIVILQLIFSEDPLQWIKSDSDVNIRIKAKDNSPLYINNGKQQMLYLLGNNYTYNINIEKIGNQGAIYGGSGAWTDLETIDYLGMSLGLYINSNYLSQIIGKTGIYKGFTLFGPSLNLISLTGKEYSGELLLKQDKLNDYSNLQKIDISNSLILLKVENLSISDINLSNVDTKSVDIRDCFNILNIKLDNAHIEKFALKYSPKISNFTISNVDIKDLIIETPDTSMEYSLLISNMDTLELINIAGYTNVTLSNCPKLNKIIFSGNDNTLLKKLTITDCPLAATSIELEERIMDLSRFTNLKNVKINNSNIAQLKFPSTGIVLNSGALKDCPNLYYLSGPITLNGNAIFVRCSKFTLKDPTGCTNGGVKNKYYNFKFGPNFTNIVSMFNCDDKAHRGSITLSAALHFIKNIVNEGIANRITDFRWAFNHLDIEITTAMAKLEHDTRKADNNDSSHDVFDFSEFIHMGKEIKVYNSYISNLECMFGHNASIYFIGGKIHCLPKSIFSFATENNVNKTYNISCYILGGAAPLDIYHPVLDKITCNLGTYWESEASTVILDPDTYKPLSTISIRDMFHKTENGQEIKAGELKKFYNFYPTGEGSVTLDFGDGSGNKESTKSAFSDLSKLYSVHGFFGAWGDFPYLIKNGDYMFHDNPITSISNSLRFENDASPVNLYTMFNWELIFNSAKEVFNRVDGVNDYWNDHPEKTEYFTDFSIRKYITLGDFYELLKIILNSKCTDVCYIFRNCRILNDGNETLMPISLELENTSKDTYFERNYLCNNTITNITMLFRGAYQVNSLEDTTKGGLKFDKDFFRVFRKVTRIRGLFEAAYLGKCIGLDLFGNRYSIEDTSIYVQLPSGEYVPAKKIEYKYRKLIIDARLLFYRTNWVENSYYYEPDPFNKLPANRIVYGDNYDLVFDGTTYYTKRIINKNPVYTPMELIPNYELIDSIIPETGPGSGYYISYLLRSYGDTNYTLNNFKIEDTRAVNKLFIAPDIAYYISLPSRNNSKNPLMYAFDSNHALCLSGMIPEHMFYLDPDYNFWHTFKGVNVIPRLLTTLTTTSEENNIYYCIPKNFTKNSNFTNCLNFNINIPDSRVGGVKILNNRVYVLLKSSVDRIDILKNALPNVANCSFNNSSKDFRIYYNIMYDDVKEQQLIKEGISYTVDDVEGLDMSKYTHLSLDNLINSTLSMFLGGRLFNKEFKIEEGTLSDSSNSIIYVNSILSRSCILPRADSPFGPLNLIHHNPNLGKINIYSDRITNRASVLNYKESLKNDANIIEL